MKVPNCTICHLPVLELDGQFEVLQGYYAGSIQGDPAISISGWCHSACLGASPHGATWHDWQLAHFTTVRGYECAAEIDGWTLLHHAKLGELFALHADGTTIGSSRTERRPTARCPGGLCLPVDEEFHLELEDEDVVSALHERLQRTGSVPILDVCRELEIEDKLRWPHVLERGVFRLDRKAQRSWGRFSISMRAAYSAFVPEPLASHWQRLA